MGLYKNNNGALEPIAGRGKAEYGASTVREGTISVTSFAKYKAVNVVFSSPMPDTNYVVEVYSDNSISEVFCLVCDKRVDGFHAVFTNTTSSTTADWTYKYRAFKLYTDTEYNNIIEAIPSTAGASNKLVDTNTLNTKAPDTEWTASSVSGFTYRKKNGIVFLHMGYTIAEAKTSDWTIPNAVLPEGFRPRKSVFGVADRDQDNSLITINIATNGTFRFYKTPSSVTQIGSGKYNGYYCFPVD